MPIDLSVGDKAWGRDSGVRHDPNPGGRILGKEKATKGQGIVGGRPGAFMGCVPTGLTCLCGAGIVARSWGGSKEP